MTELLLDWPIQAKLQVVRIVRSTRIPGNGYALGFHPDARYREAMGTLNGASLAFVKQHLGSLGGKHDFKTQS